MQTIRCVLLNVLVFVPQVAVAQSAIEIDPALVLNTHADQVGIWIDSRQETLNPKLIAALKSLRLSSIRYGWQFGLFDRADTRSEQHRPLDPKTDGYFSNGQGRMAETIGPQGVADLLDEIDAVGFAVVATDGINYRGTIDAELAGMSEEERLSLYAKRASDWAAWSRDRRFRYFEIGNENDISGHGEQLGIIDRWTPSAYARVARRYVTEMKRANPLARCGINGGLRSPDEVISWFETIAASEPSLPDALDFLVAHKYEMWLDFPTWSAHADWDFGRVGQEFRDCRNRFFPKLPIHVTEIGSWKTGEIDQHYRSLLMTEMLGNVYQDAAVEHVQVWPTRWTTEGGVFGNSRDSELSPMGLGVKAYTAFARPILFASGAKSNVRFFASRGEQKGTTVWLVNHAESPRELVLTMKQMSGGTDAWQRWQLVSPSENPRANDTTLERIDDVNHARADSAIQLSLAVPALSVTVLTSDSIRVHAGN